MIAWVCLKSVKILRGAAKFRNSFVTGVNIQQTIPIRILLDAIQLFRSVEVGGEPTSVKRRRRDSQSRPEEIYSPVLCYDYRT